jgi:myo-inositol-1(or 4)-monophosphatase
METEHEALSGEQLEELFRFSNEVVRRGGEVGLKFYGKSRGDVKFDEKLVTEAELAIRESMIEMVRASYPSHHFFSEGLGDPADMREHGGGFVWINDPLDGTANFQAGIPIWGLSMAFFHNYWPVFGIFSMPVTGEAYTAFSGKEAYKNNRKIKVRCGFDPNNESLLFTYSRFHTDLKSDFPGKIRNLGSAQAHITYVAGGAADAVVLKNTYIWDLAASNIILESAGGEVRYLDGRPFILGEHLDGRKIEEPLIAAGQGVHRILGNYLSIR